MGSPASARHTFDVTFSVPPVNVGWKHHGRQYRCPTALLPLPLPPDPETAARLYEQGLSDPSVPSGDRRPPPPPPEAIQAHFPDLEVEAILGEGGMGVVYRARQKRLDRIVALKVLPEGLSQDPAFAERFEREARTLARLDHPHIVRVFDFGERDGLYYLLMEYVDGANLRDVLHEGRMRPEEALRIVPQICEGLQFAHDAGVIHRDVKPENILIDAQGNAKITDFGLAKLLEHGPRDVTLTGTGQVMGTVQYMAPEQYRTPQTVDHRADIFSLGVVFYEMLTGELPVGRFRPPSHDQAMDRRIDEIVLKALERERELRYQRVGQVSTDVYGLRQPGPLPVSAPALVSTPAPTPNPAEAAGAAGRGGRWALVPAALAIPLGFAAFGLMHEAWGGVERGTTDAFLRELCKGLAAVLFFGVGTFFAIRAAIHARRRNAPGGRFTLALVLALSNFLLIPTVMVVAAVEIQQHAISDAPRARERLRAEDEHQAVMVAAKGLVARLHAARPGSPEGVLTEGDLDAALRLYDTASEAEIRRMPHDERARAAAAGRLGLPLADLAPLEAPLAEFRVDRVGVESEGREALVTLSRRGGGYFTHVTFPIRSGSREVAERSGGALSGVRGWFFASGPVEVHHLDRPEEK